MKWRIRATQLSVVAAVAAGLVTGPAASSSASLDLTNRTLGGISCVDASFCVAVGNGSGQEGIAGTTSQFWNGAAWRTVPVPSPTLYYRLDGVSCFSAKNCLAVGSSSKTGAQLSDAWNGTTWLRLPAQAGALSGVDCPAAGRCVAVGNRRVSGQPTALAQLWNGKTWTRLTPVKPAGATSSLFDAISCSGPVNCVAVGQADSEAVAESWNGASWTMLPSPAGLTTLTGVSCPTSTTCVAVGAGPNGTSIASALWNGSSWTALTISSPVIGLAGIPALTGVSCSSATHCIAVGTDTGPIAEQWTGGSSWQQLSVPTPVATYYFAGVSCPASTACVAVGGVGDTPSLSGYSAFAEAWNGSRWRVLRTGQVDVLAGVSCSGVSHCLLVGSYLDRADVTRTLAQSWNGKAMRLVSPPGLTGGLGPVSCPSATFCLAGDNGTSAIRNGKHWTFLPPSGPAFIDAEVSCVSKNFCLSGPRGAIWNGRRWRQAPFRSEGDDQTTDNITGISCLSRKFCMATGYEEDDQEDGPTVQTLVEIWNGSGWSFGTPPAPGSQQGELGPVSCFSPTNCTTTGYFVPSFASELFAAHWNGVKWRIFKLPHTADFPALYSGPSAISCPTATSCVAVGFYDKNLTSIDTPYVWNGRTWRLTKTTGPGGLESVSCAASTQCVAVGAAGNPTLAKLWNGKTWHVLKTLNP